MDTILKSILETATSVSVYALEKPKTASLPCIVYQRISDVPYVSQNGKLNTHKVRVQIKVLADSYSGMRSLVQQVEEALIANTGDFKLSTKVLREFQPDLKEEDVIQSNADYYIWN